MVLRHLKSPILEGEDSWFLKAHTDKFVFSPTPPKVKILLFSSLPLL